MIRAEEGREGARWIAEHRAFLFQACAKALRQRVPTVFKGQQGGHVAETVRRRGTVGRWRDRWLDRQTGVGVCMETWIDEWLSDEKKVVWPNTGGKQ